MEEKKCNHGELVLCANCTDLSKLQSYSSAPQSTLAEDMLSMKGIAFETTSSDGKTVTTNKNKERESSTLSEEKKEYVFTINKGKLKEIPPFEHRRGKPNLYMGLAEDEQGKRWDIFSAACDYDNDGMTSNCFCAAIARDDVWIGESGTPPSLGDDNTFLGAPQSTLKEDCFKCHNLPEGIVIKGHDHRSSTLSEEATFSDEIESNTFIFKIQDKEIKITPEGFYWNGKLVEDDHEIYKSVKSFFQSNTPSLLGDWRGKLIQLIHEARIVANPSYTPIESLVAQVEKEAYQRGLSNMQDKMRAYRILTTEVDCEKLDSKVEDTDWCGHCGADLSPK